MKLSGFEVVSRCNTDCELDLRSVSYRDYGNKGQFRSRPISAFVDNFALSQSECVIGYYFR